jgi:antitoxin component YwqK of YwqJK toxin-antitoxin module
MKKLLVGLCTVGLLASSLVHAVEHDWTNKQGKTIKAGFVSAGEEAVTISMGGKSYVVKLADLTPQSRALAAKLRVQKSKAREPQNDKTPPVKPTAVAKIDLDDETLNRIIAEAIDGDTLQKRGEKGKELEYAPNEQTPYTGWVKRMYDNGQIKGLGQCKDGKRNGLSTRWDENGQKMAEGSWKDGKLFSAVAWKPNGEKCPVTKIDKDGNGVVVMYNEDGTEEGRAILKDGEMVSLMQTQWHENGQKESESTLKDDKPDGLWTYWHENGQKGREETYKDGSLEGVSEWYESGQKKSESTFEGENELSEVATEWEWYSNGQKKSESIYKDGELNGPAVEWHENGQKAWEGAYKDGKADGLQTEWYENGQKSLEGTFKDGEEISFKSWDEDGNPE